MAEPKNIPVARMPNPSATVSLGPSRAATRSAGTAPRTMPAIAGRNRSPAPWASRPMMAWRYCGSVKRTPNIPKTPAAARMIPQLKLRERKRRRSMSGSPPGRAVSQASHRTNVARMPKPTTDGTVALELLQPLSPASTSPYMSMASPVLESSTPRMSMLGRRSLRDCGTKRMTALRPIRMTGTFMRKTQPHQKWANT